MKYLGPRLLSILVLVGVIGYGYYTIEGTPRHFPVQGRFVVNEDESLRSISYRLEEEHFIASAFWFRVWTSFTGKDRHVQLGEYEFERAYSLREVVSKLVSGTPDRPLVQVTIPEGSTIFETATIINRAIPEISVESFINTVSSLRVEGKLFPSTYFLLPSSTADSVIKLMVSTFEKRYASTFDAKKLPEPLTIRDEVISLASILEGEAKTEEDMRIVAGILLARLKYGMPLQVDAAPETYKTKGIPPIPINNPGMMSLLAVFNPTNSQYLFYLTGKDGAMHYAKTYDEHKRNIRKYLR
jgi:UPF0755 protein